MFSAAYLKAKSILYGNYKGKKKSHSCGKQTGIFPGNTGGKIQKKKYVVILSVKKSIYGGFG